MAKVSPVKEPQQINVPPTSLAILCSALSTLFYPLVFPGPGESHFPVSPALFLCLNQLLSRNCCLWLARQLFLPCNGFFSSCSTFIIFVYLFYYYLLLLCLVFALAVISKNRGGKVLYRKNIVLKIQWKTSKSSSNKQLWQLFYIVVKRVRYMCIFQSHHFIPVVWNIGSLCQQISSCCSVQQIMLKVGILFLTEVMTFHPALPLISCLLLCPSVSWFVSCCIWIFLFFAAQIACLHRWVLPRRGLTSGAFTAGNKCPPRTSGARAPELPCAPLARQPPLFAKRDLGTLWRYPEASQVLDGCTLCSTVAVGGSRERVWPGHCLAMC